MIEYADLAKLIAKPAIQESLPLFKRIKNEVAHFMNDGLLDYFNKQLNKHRMIKTFIHRQPTVFYDIYYPAKLTYQPNYSNSAQVVTTDSVDELFKEHKYITLIGDAGSGKSTLLIHLFIHSFIEGYKAPIILELRNLNNIDINFFEYVKKIIFDNKLSKDETIFIRLLEKGEFIFFLDGFDEILASKKDKLTQEIESFINVFPDNNYLITSRPYSDIESFGNFHNYQIRDLDKEDIKNFIQGQQLEAEHTTELIETIEQVSHSEDKRYIEEFLVNPLLLSLFIITHKGNENDIPKNKYIFYSRVFEVLFREHDSYTKTGYSRELRSKLDQEQVEKVLKLYSLISYMNGEINVSKIYLSEKLDLIKEKYKDLNFKNNDFLYDMKSAIGIFVEDGGIVSFSHRSLQEYFAALYIATLQSKKKEMYEKIILACSENNFINESMNFLSLCEEMDNINFIKYFKLPILEKVLKSIPNSNKGKFIWLINQKPRKFMIRKKDNEIYVKSYTLANKNKDISMNTYIAIPYFENMFIQLIIEEIKNNTQLNEYIYKTTAVKKQANYIDYSFNLDYNYNNQKMIDDFYELINKQKLEKCFTSNIDILKNNIEKSTNILEENQVTETNVINMF